MSLQPTWLVPARILHLRAAGDASETAMNTLSSDFNTLINQGHAPVHIIVESQVSAAHTSSATRASQSMGFLRNPNLGWVVFVGKHNYFQSVMIELVVRITRLRYREVSTFEAALAFLQEHDQTMDWSQVAPPQ